MNYHRKYANRVKSSRVNTMESSIKYIDSKNYRGYISYLKMIDVKKPFIRKIGSEHVCFGDNGYIWIQTFEENKNHSITIMLDENENIIQWYIDIVKDMGLSADGVPYIEDLYLDLDILPNGSSYLLDEDEILYALENNYIGVKDYNLAYKEIADFKEKYILDIEKLYDFTSWIIKKVKE